MANNVFKEIDRGSLPGLKRCLSLFPACAAAKNSAGSTPLHIATSLGLAPFVKELLLHGAPHDVADAQGNLPLHLAAEQGSLECVTELLTGPGRKLAVKVKNKDGQAPLHLAVRNGHTAIAAKLLEAGARTDAKDKSGNTPLELVSQTDEELLQLLLASTPTSSLGSTSLGLGVAALARGAADNSLSAYRAAPGGGGNATSRIASTPQPPSPAAAARPPPGGTPLTARTPPPAAPSPSGTPGGMTSRLPRNNASSGGVSQQHGASSGGGAAAAATTGPGGAAVTGPAAAAQLQKHEATLQKHDTAMQALQADLRAAAERLGTVDAVASAQLECSSQLEKALETCGSHSRVISELDARLAFQEERGRDVRSRVERLEEGERVVQDSVSRLTTDHRSLGLQLREMSEQVAALRAVRPAAIADAGSGAAQQQLQAEVAGLRAQLEVLSPVMMVATTASAETRALAMRLDALQQQVQQQSQHPHPHQVAGGAALEQQILQLQAQVQLLQLPVASLTQQCADMSAKLGGFADWQQQARADLEKLMKAAESGKEASSGPGASGSELSDAVMRVLDTTARTLTEMRQQQDVTAKQVAELMQQRQHSAPPSTPLPPGTPVVPSTPNGAHQQPGDDAGAATLGGPPSRNMRGGSVAREMAAQAELRAELEALKEVVADVRKEVATEGGSLRREWQRAFSDMQSRYGEQANELQRREQNIAKLREAALVEEAERRATSGFEDKVSKRLTKLETGLEYLTHRFEVLEEQVSGMATTLAGANSPGFVLSPSALAAASAAVAARGQQRGAGPSASGPGPVSENHGRSIATASHLAIAAASVASSPLGHGKAKPPAGALPPAAAGALATAGQNTKGGLPRSTHLDGEPATMAPQSRSGSVGPTYSAAAVAGSLAHVPAASGSTLRPEAPNLVASSAQANRDSRAGSASSSRPALGSEITACGPAVQPSVGPVPSPGPWHSGPPSCAIDPASVALGPQLLPATAQAFLSPSVDIQRVAAMAAARQQHDQGPQHPMMATAQQQVPLAYAAGAAVSELPGGSTGPLESAAKATVASQAPGQAHPRKEPPMCLYCSVQ